MWQRFASCIAFLILTNEIRSYDLLTASHKNIREALESAKDVKDPDQWCKDNFRTDDVSKATHVLFRMDRTTHPLIRGEMKPAKVPFE